MVGSGGSSHLWLCWGVVVFGHVYCQPSREYAPQNLTLTADYDSLNVTWVAPEKNGPDLKAFRVQVFFNSSSQPQPQPQPQTQPQPFKDQWVPKGSQDPHHYAHEVTCLKPNQAFRVNVLAVYGPGVNVSETDALSDPQYIDIKPRSILDDLFDHPIQIALGAGITILIVLVVIPAACFCMYKRRSRRYVPGLTTTRVVERSLTTTIPPSAKELRVLEARDQTPSGTGATATGATAVLQQSPPIAVATQQSPLLKSSPLSSYQSGCSVPSQIAPARPFAATGAHGQEVMDAYELEDDVYENVQEHAALAKPRFPVVKSTSFSVSRPCQMSRGRGGRRAPLSINEGTHGGDGAGGDGDNDDDEDYMNLSIGRRCATMPSKEKKPQGKSTKAPIECFQEEDSDIYGNC